ncbi:hypothetical protein KEM52_000001 [Ascosphaera acerosa]|nr:hypothetical protein KEM52_000001 [Ascosphaera acerosa]
MGYSAASNIRVLEDNAKYIKQDRLKAKLYELNPDIKNTPGGEETVKAVMREKLQEAWAAIPEEFFASLTTTVDHRFEAVVKAKG